MAECAPAPTLLQPITPAASLVETPAPLRSSFSTVDGMSAWDDRAQLDRMVSALSSMPLFASLPHSELEAIVRSSRIHLHAQHRVVYREGTRANWVGVLVAGQVTLTDGAGRVRLVERTAESAPQLLGEEGGLSMCISRLSTAASSSADFVLLAIPHSVIPSALHAPIRHALVCHLLQKAGGLFSSGQDTPTALAQLAPCCELLEFTRGSSVIRQGDAADALYILCWGRLAVVIGRYPGDRDAQTTGHLTPYGERSFFGEVALLEWAAEREARSAHYALGVPEMSRRRASVVAADDSYVLRIAASHFGRLTQCVPDFEERARIVARILQHGDQMRVHKWEREQLLRTLMKLESATLSRAAHSILAVEHSTRLPLLKQRLMALLARHRDMRTATSAKLTASTDVLLALKSPAGSVRFERKQRESVEAKNIAAASRQWKKTMQLKRLDSAPQIDFELD